MDLFVALKFIALIGPTPRSMSFVRHSNGSFVLFTQRNCSDLVQCRAQEQGKMHVFLLDRLVLVMQCN